MAFGAPGCTRYGLSLPTKPRQPKTGSSPTSWCLWGRYASSTELAQLSSRLAYEKKVPKFLQRLQNQVNGTSREEDEPRYYDEDGNEFNGPEDEAELDEFGRERRPQLDEFGRESRSRPAIPERPDDDPGSADEDSADEKPQVVVLKAGKHLSEREAENERRKEKGLPSLPDPNHPDESPTTASASKEKSTIKSLSFSSGKPSAKSKASNDFNALKRKVLSGGDDSDDSQSGKAAKEGKGRGDGGSKMKKKKKQKKTLLSFGDDA
ncbi:hypothetical protein BDP27DRAFT_1367078 [Rhodocollybia butyracea]|uniref:DUF4604 domain-containing protein n=1 Tax=Rhodocollybia butyracea TaxID=206335 RepID=A0A9P5PIQ1_9AGAR|nr:hypothetical protein BDP27DRAFT_1367078 [Rhodocollybia butyracea]